MPCDRSFAMVRRSRSRSSRSYKSLMPEGVKLRPRMPEGVKLRLVCKDVPVLTLANKHCVFSKLAAWMSQTALSNTEKADALFEYCDDRDIMKECSRLGLKECEVAFSIARVRHRGLRHVGAVGATDKRSVMLALVVALARQDPFDLRTICNEMCGYRYFCREFLALVDSSFRCTESPPQSEGDEDTRDAIEGPSCLPSLQLIGKGRLVPVLGAPAKNSIFHNNAAWLIQTATGTSGKADSVFRVL